MSAIAADDVRAKIAHPANFPPEYTALQNGEMLLDGATTGTNIVDVMRAAGVFELQGDGAWAPPGGAFDDDGGHGPYAMQTFGAALRPRV